MKLKEITNIAQADDLLVTVWSEWKQNERQRNIPYNEIADVNILNMEIKRILSYKNQIEVVVD